MNIFFGREEVIMLAHHIRRGNKIGTLRFVSPVTIFEMRYDASNLIGAGLLGFALAGLCGNANVAYIKWKTVEQSLIDDHRESLIRGTYAAAEILGLDPVKAYVLTRMMQRESYSCPEVIRSIARGQTIRGFETDKQDMEAYCLLMSAERMQKEETSASRVSSDRSAV